MSANKNKPTAADETSRTGRVVKKKFGVGSKSEHDAIYLQTKEAEYVLRRVGGNPFADDVLHQLVGKQITAWGIINDYTFFAKKIKEEKQ